MLLCIPKFQGISKTFHSYIYSESWKENDQRVSLFSSSFQNIMKRSAEMPFENLPLVQGIPQGRVLTEA